MGDIEVDHLPIVIDGKYHTIRSNDGGKSGGMDIIVYDKDTKLTRTEIKAGEIQLIDVGVYQPTKENINKEVLYSVLPRSSLSINKKNPAYSYNCMGINFLKNAGSGQIEMVNMSNHTRKPFQPLDPNVESIATTQLVIHDEKPVRCIDIICTEDYDIKNDDGIIGIPANIISRENISDKNKGYYGIDEGEVGIIVENTYMTDNGLMIQNGVVDSSYDCDLHPSHEKYDKNNLRKPGLNILTGIRPMSNINNIKISAGTTIATMYIYEYYYVNSDTCKLIHMKTYLNDMAKTDEGKRRLKDMDRCGRGFGSSGQDGSQWKKQKKI